MTPSPAFQALVAAARAYHAAPDLPAAHGAWAELLRRAGDDKHVARLALEYAAVERQLRRAVGDLP